MLHLATNKKIQALLAHYGIDPEDDGPSFSNSFTKAFSMISTIGWFVFTDFYMLIMENFRSNWSRRFFDVWKNSRHSLRSCWSANLPADRGTNWQNDHVSMDGNKLYLLLEWRFLIGIIYPYNWHFIIPKRSLFCWFDFFGMTIVNFFLDFETWKG